jgi:hypothetical protein
MLESLKLVNTADNSEIALKGAIDGNILTLTPGVAVANGTYKLINLNNIVSSNSWMAPAELPEYYITVNNTTTIEGVDAEVEEDVIYDLSGRRITEITNSGIYIVNGKKVLVK